MVIGTEWKELKRNNSAGGVIVVLSDSSQGKEHTFSVAALMLMTFCRPRRKGEVARHYHDPDPWNLNLWNLRWGTQTDNLNDFTRHTGKHMRAKLTPSQAKEIRQRIANGERQSDLAREYGVTDGAITYIKQGKTHSLVN